MEDGMIIRYIGIKTEYGITWYIDDTDSVEVGDKILVSLQGYDVNAKVAVAARCVYPHVVYPYHKTLSVIEIVERAEKKK